MSRLPMSEAHKRALIVAYYLSRYDRKGMRALGYETYKQAFTELGARLGVKAATLKNMRDEFDPYCSPVRQGWHKRPMARTRINVIEAYENVSEAAVAEVVRDVLNGGDDALVRQFTAPIEAAGVAERLSGDDNNAFANRLLTGQTAETFFMEQFAGLERFKGSQLEDTRSFGIGFDFRALFAASYQAIEVKGLRQAHGYVSFTDREWATAGQMQNDYILALVRSLETQPALELIPNPAVQLNVRMRSVEVIAVTWNARV